MDNMHQSAPPFTMQQDHDDSFMIQEHEVRYMHTSMNWVAKGHLTIIRLTQNRAPVDSLDLLVGCPLLLLMLVLIRVKSLFDTIPSGRSTVASLSSESSPKSTRIGRRPTLSSSSKALKSVESCAW
jgi:hypothetical protein